MKLKYRKTKTNHKFEKKIENSTKFFSLFSTILSEIIIGDMPKIVIGYLGID